MPTTSKIDAHTSYVITDRGIVYKVCAYCGILVGMMDLGVIKIGKITKKVLIEPVFDEFTHQLVEVEVITYFPSIRTVEGCYDCRMKYFDAQLTANLYERKTGKKREAFLDLRDRPQGGTQ